MVTTKYPYLDELASSLWLRPEMEQLHALHLIAQSIRSGERHRLGLSLQNSFPSPVNMGIQQVLAERAEQLPGGMEAVMGGFDAIETALTPDVIDALCVELVPDRIPNDADVWYALRLMHERQLREILFRIIFAWMFGHKDIFSELLRELREQLR